jgi:NCS1 family nucleobase:cation symporter-1
MSDHNLSNADLAPVKQEERTWGSLNYFSLWVAMAVCIPSYMIAASLVQGGMNWQQAIFTVLVGNVIVLIPMLLNGQAGAKYGIPFPVLAGASFGTKGANIPSLLRAIVACGWFGIQTWIGGAAIYTLLLMMWPAAGEVASGFLGIGLMPFVCFMLFWVMNMYVIHRGSESIKWLETACAPVLILCGFALLFWAYTSANGFGNLLDVPSKFETNAQFWKFFFPALTGIVGFWATLSLNISDFTRYAKNQRSQLMGQAFGLPPTMTLFAFVGIVVTGATVLVYGEAIWDPVVLVRKFESPFIVALSMAAVIIATLSTNVAANVVSPANSFSNLSPSKITFRVGGYITGVIGILMMPWKLLEDPTGYIFTWLIGYSALLGPIAGILIVDYFFIRKMKLNVDELYKWDGLYSYSGGFNMRAVAALVIGILPNVPGFLAQIKVIGSDTFPMITPLYNYAWFIGLFISSFAYYAFMRSERSSVEVGDAEKIPA